MAKSTTVKTAAAAGITIISAVCVASSSVMRGLMDHPTEGGLPPWIHAYNTPHTSAPKATIGQRNFAAA